MSYVAEIDRINNDIPSVNKITVGLIGEFDIIEGIDGLIFDDSI